MNDIIIPARFDLTKNLHGHVRVETRSRWTGRVVDSQEKDNLITDAVQKMLMTDAWYGNMGSVWTPIWSGLLGGVMLFDGTLTADAGNIYFPASAKLVGYAGQGSDSINPMAGSYNGSESVAVSNGFTTVWDFLSSQANGTIASLARTSSAIGSYIPYSAYQFDLRPGGLGTNYPVYYSGYDETNKYIYFCLAGQYTIDGVAYSEKNIYRVKCNLEAIDMTGNILPGPTQWELVKTLTTSDTTDYETRARNFVYDKYANNLARSYNNTAVDLIALDGTHSRITTVGASGTKGFAVSENYYWKLSNDTLYRTEKSNLANTKSYSITADQIFTGEYDICYALAGSDVSIIYPDDTIITRPMSNSIYVPRQVGPFYTYGQLVGNSNNTSNSYRLFPRSNYLGTIANLDSPVTKTSSQTMKISYTLTEA